MNATEQRNAAKVFEATGYSYYRQITVRGNVAELERIPWATALVLIQRGQCKGWILARDEREPADVVDLGMWLANNAEAGGHP